MLRRMSPLLAQSGHTRVAPHMSAFGGKADISRTPNELFLSYIGPFPSAGLSRYDALALSLGEGNETARRSSKNTTQDVKSPQCAEGWSQAFRRRCIREDCAARAQVERGAGAASSNCRRAQSHQPFDVRFAGGALYAGRICRRGSARPIMHGCSSARAIFSAGSPATAMQPTRTRASGTIS